MHVHTRACSHTHLQPHIGKNLVHIQKGHKHARKSGKENLFRHWFLFFQITNEKEKIKDQFWVQLFVFLWLNTLNSLTVGAGQMTLENGREDTWCWPCYPYSRTCMSMRAHKLTWGHICMHAVVLMCSSKNNLKESCLSIYLVCPRNSSRFVSFGDKQLYLLSHFSIL